VARPYQTGFSRSILGHTLRWRARRDHGDPRARVSPVLDDWRDGIHPSLGAAAARVVAEDGVVLHDHADTLISSMAFAFNLFLPFRDRPAALDAWASETLGRAVQIERVGFEWVPPGDVLGELAGDRPQGNEKATAIDVVLWGRAAARAVVVLVEVKLTEGHFTPCGGRASRANPRREVCDTPGTFRADPDACYLRRPRRAARDRRYWLRFRRAQGSVEAAHPGLAWDGPCPFAGDHQQPMRQRAAALGLEQEGLVDDAFVVLVHHDDNPDVPGPWDRYVALSQAEARMKRRPATSLFLHGPAEHAAWMRDRYRLPAGP
jgi:hypothetical protein